MNEIEHKIVEGLAGFCCRQQLNPNIHVLQEEAGRMLALLSDQVLNQTAAAKIYGTTRQTFAKKARAAGIGFKASGSSRLFYTLDSVLELKSSNPNGTKGVS